MIRDNYTYKKYQKELARKKKAEEKKQKKLEKKATEAVPESGQVPNDQVTLDLGGNMGYQGGGSGGGFGGGFGGPREMHKAVCSECKKECEVPFKPRNDRPIYCKDCYSKRKNEGR